MYDHSPDNPQLHLQRRPWTARTWFLVALASGIAALQATGATPPWWQERDVTFGKPQDYAVVNAGQLKRIACLASLELDAKLPGGVGKTIKAMIAGFLDPTNAQDFAAVNAGQLKAVVAPFYDRLKESNWPCILPEGMTRSQDYPWSGSPQPTNDYALVNLGQVKYAFSFDPLGVHMSPDFDRNGEITEDDELRYLAKGTFRFWVNDDLDIGDDATAAQDDAPEGSYMYLREEVAARALNSVDNKVNGLRDLVDFFPIRITFPVDRFPPGEYTYKLKSARAAINFVYTDLTPKTVGRIHRERIAKGFGVNGDQPPADATTVTVTTEGTVIDPVWLCGNYQILLIEGRRISTAPLVLEISKGDQAICSCQMNLSISPVKDMFRYLNVRTGDSFFTTDCPNNPSTEGKWTTNLDEPSNYPDGFYNPAKATQKTLVLVHGLDWDESETPGGNAEIFKRFFQSGLNARVIAVSWASNTGRTFGAPLDYDRDVIGSFVAARLVKDGLASFWGSNTSVFAHSLGNMLVSSMIEDYDTRIGNYFMINAAVPVEAYDGRSMIPLADQWRMVPTKWKKSVTPPPASYTKREMCAGWSGLFTNTDPRSTLTWDGRFRHVPDRTTLWQFYSTGEEILCGSDGVVSPLVHILDFWNWSSYDTVAIDRERVWAYNEMTKGIPTLGTIVVPFHDQAGWAFGTYWLTYPATNCNPYTPSEIAAVPTSDLISRPLFAKFAPTDTKVPKWGNSDDWIYRPDNDPVVCTRIPFLPLSTASMALLKNHAKVLAESLPSLSDAAGYCELTRLHGQFTENTFNLTKPPLKHDNLWPTSRPTKTKRQVNDRRWLHGDYKDPAYLFNHTLYDTIAPLAD